MKLRSSSLLGITGASERIKRKAQSVEHVCVFECGHYTRAARGTQMDVLLLLRICGRSLHAFIAGRVAPAACLYCGARRPRAPIRKTLAGFPKTLPAIDASARITV